MSTGTMQTIADIAEVNPQVNLCEIRGDTRVSFIPMADVSSCGVWMGRQERLLDEVRVGYTPFQENDVLFAKITPCMENGKGAHARGLTNGLGFGSTEFYVLRAKGDNSARFIFHCLQSSQARSRAVAFMGGSAGQQRVQADFFTHFEIPANEPAAQIRIASILDMVDEAIAKTEAVIAKLKQVRTGLLHDLLTRGLDEHGQLRDPIVHPEQFANTPLGRLPKIWACEPLAKHTLSSAYGPRFSGEHYSEKGNIALLRTTDMDSEGNLNLDQMPLAKLSLDEFQMHLLKESDLLVSRSGTCGIASVFPGFRFPVLPGAFLIRFRLALSLRSEFLRLYFNSAIGSAHNRNIAEGGVQKNIRGSAVLAHFIPVPQPTEQDAILQVAHAWNDTFTAGVLELEKLQCLKRGLMCDLLTGHLRTTSDVFL